MAPTIPPDEPDVASWLSAGKVSGRYQVMPPPTMREYLDLEASIREHGVLEHIVIDEHSDTIDGHYRQEIAARLGLEYPTRIVEGLTHAEKIAMALTLNVDRRHLNAAQRRELLAKSLIAQPELSDREHAKRIGTSPTTAGDVRRDLEAEGAVSKLDTRTDTTGRKQPASKPEPDNVIPIAGGKKPKPDNAQRIADSETTRVVKQVNIAAGMAKQLVSIDGFTDAHRERISKTVSNLLKAIGL
jgi:hypothetical protein